jgi:hypothetical protein
MRARYIPTLSMDRRKEHFEQTIARAARLLESAHEAGENAKRIVHDARNRRHHAALLRGISRMLRRARRPAETG